MKNSEMLALYKYVENSLYYSGIGEIFFFAALSLMVFLKFLGLDFGNDIYKIASITTIIFLLIKVFDTRYTKKEIIKMFLLFISAFLFLIISRKPTLSISILFLISSKGINIKKYFKVFFLASIIPFVLVVILSLLNILPNVAITMSRMSAEGIVQITRYSLGYYHPNVTYMYFFIIISLYILIRNNSLRRIEYILIIFISIVLYLITLSRSGLICTLLLLIMLIFYKKFFEFCTLFKSFISFIPLIIGGSVLLLSYLYTENNIIISIINKIFSGRLFYNKMFLAEFGIPIIGTNVNAFIASGNYLDSSYIILLMNYGIITFCVFLYCSFKVIKQLSISNINFEVYVFSIILFYCITEHFLLNILINFMLIYYRNLIFEEENEGLE